MVEWKCSCFPYMNTSNLLHCRERLNSEVHDQAVEICGSWLSQVSPWFLMGPVTSFHWTKWAASRINTCTGIKREISCLHLDRPANRQPASGHQVHKGAHYICYVHTNGTGGIIIKNGLGLEVWVSKHLYYKYKSLLRTGSTGGFPSVNKAQVVYNSYFVSIGNTSPCTCPFLLLWVLRPENNITLELAIYQEWITSWRQRNPCPSLPSPTIFKFTVALQLAPVGFFLFFISATTMLPLITFTKMQASKCPPP